MSNPTPPFLLCNKLLAARKAAGMSKTAVVRIINIGMETLTCVEDGRRSVTPSELAQFNSLYKSEVK